MVNSSKLFIFLLISIFFIAMDVNSKNAVPDTPFIQEYHEAFPIGETSDMNDVRAIAIDRAGNAWAATRAGAYKLEKGKKQWTSMMSDDEVGPAFDIVVDQNNTVWIGAWNGLYRSMPDRLEKIKNINQPISALCATENEFFALGPDGMWHFSSGKWLKKEMPYSRSIRSVKSDGNGGYWIATGMGLYHQTETGHTLYQTAEELLSADIYDVAYDSDGNLWIGGLGGITIYKDGRRLSHLTPAKGLPDIVVQSISKAPDGTMWIGTKTGVARYRNGKWSFLHSRRWLLSDDVRAIAFDDEGTPWIATENGVSAIKRKTMTLAEKADYFHRICMKRHVREPGLVEKCRLPIPGDTSKWEPQDDDNDGQYTSMYLAMESFRHAVTKSPEVKANAKRAFEALRFLQTVTETNGFVARTVIPGSWARMFDPNRTYTEQEKAEIRIHEPRYKPVEKRWRLSPDGKWLWKGDTSSDEITGHMFGYLFYFDLVADKKEKQLVRDHVCRIVDYIIDGGYVLKDIDGTHTRWAVWSPEKLNHDPDWRAERGVNSVEILSYLKLAYHVSGNERYQKEYIKLLHEHGYAENVRQAKEFNPSWITHIDDELLALAYPCLLRHEDDPELQKLYRESLDRWYNGIKKDNSPYFDFTYAALSNVRPDVKKSKEWFQDTPLDLVRWRVDNTMRADVQLVRSPELESVQTNRLLPPGEIALFRWDNNPWYAVQGDGGHTESDGVFWLLPYWMGRYYGYLE